MAAPPFSPSHFSRRQRAGIAVAVLGWYDEHARRLPWRVGPRERMRGIRPDPYRVWLSEIMLQQTTVATVIPRYQQFLARWPSVEALADAPLDAVLGAWAGLGYYARARNLHACARAVKDDFAGQFPGDEAMLATLPGIGAYTAAAMAAIAFDQRALPVDGNIERVMARLFAIATPKGKLKADARGALDIVWPDARHGDFTQALMDLGSGICTPRNPDCGTCPLAEWCRAKALGQPEKYPARAAKKPKPTRTGICYALFRADGSVLLETRPEAGLLGGMLGLPGTPWTADEPVDDEPVDDKPGDDKPSHDDRSAWPAIAQPTEHIDWTDGGVITHEFTHFRLNLSVRFGDKPRQFRATCNQQWLPARDAPVPTVMRKAIDCALSARASGPPKG